eukprot:486047-Pleurochrysis_carterae.AAC.1
MANTAAEAAQQRRCAAAGEQSPACFGPTLKYKYMPRISKISRIVITRLGVGLDHRRIHHLGRNICKSKLHSVAARSLTSY